jgi:ABC-2 type transport system permease protein
MRHLLGNALIIARRDFMAVVATPTFLLFLLAPFLMLGVSIASGIGGAYLAKGHRPYPDGRARAIPRCGFRARWMRRP